MNSYTQKIRNRRILGESGHWPAAVRQAAMWRLPAAGWESALNVSFPNRQSHSPDPWLLPTNVAIGIGQANNWGPTPYIFHPHIATLDQRHHRVWPTFIESTFGFLRAYYEVVPKGSFRIDYTVRINNAGEFSMPPTWVEAMYAPDVFGEVPNGKVVVGN